MSKKEKFKVKNLAKDISRSLLLPSKSAPALTQLEKRLYRSGTKLAMTLSREDIASRERDVLNDAAALVRRWEWLKAHGLWP